MSRSSTQQVRSLCGLVWFGVIVDTRRRVLCALCSVLPAPCFWCWGWRVPCSLFGGRWFGGAEENEQEDRWAFEKKAVNILRGPTRAGGSLRDLEQFMDQAAESVTLWHIRRW